MKDIRVQDQEFIEKRRSEERRCQQCSLPVENPFAERCPRCYALLPRVEVHCQGCFYQQVCPANTGEHQQHHTDELG